MSKPHETYAHILIRDIDLDVATAFRERCKADGRTQKWILVEFMKHYAAHGLPIAPKGRK